MMTNVSYVLFSSANILCLSLAGYIIKKYLKRFPNKMIPLLNTIASLIITCIWGTSSNHEHMLLFCAQMGIIYGLASVGLHQVIKQTIDYFKIRNYVKNGRKGKSHIVSMSD